MYVCNVLNKGPFKERDGTALCYDQGDIHVNKRMCMARKYRNHKITHYTVRRSIEQRLAKTCPLKQNTI